MQFLAGRTELVHRESVRSKLTLGYVTPDYVLYDINFCVSSSSPWRTIRKRYANFLVLDAKVGSYLAPRMRLGTMCPKHMSSTRADVVD
jgi:hypothetical protein